MTDEHDAELLEALTDVCDTLADERRLESEFYPAAQRFLELFHAQLVERRLVDVPLDEWDPRPALLGLEGELAVNRSLDIDLAAACRTVHDSLDIAAGELAALN
jgi:hypothetical protein